MRLVNALSSAAVVLMAFLGALGPRGFFRALPQWFSPTR
jgi:hypothetical protein